MSGVGSRNLADYNDLNSCCMMLYSGGLLDRLAGISRPSSVLQSHIGTGNELRIAELKAEIIRSGCSRSSSGT